MIEKDVINFRRYIEFMDRLQEEILCYEPPALTGHQQLRSWVRLQLRNVAFVDENDETMSARITEVMIFEEEDRKKKDQD